MASLALHLKPSQTLLKYTSSNLNFSFLFSSSSSSSSSSDNNNNNNGGDKPHPFSSYFDDIKSKLKQQEEQRQQQQQQRSSGFRQSTTGYFNPQGSSIPKKVASIDEIKKNLSEFRRRSTVLPQNLAGNAGNPNPNGNTERKILSFDTVRESLRRMQGAGGNTSDKMSLNNYKKSLKMQPEMRGSGFSGGGGGRSKVIGGSLENLPMEVFGKEIRGEMKTGEAMGDKNESLEFELHRMYTHDELGKRLRELRPEVKGKDKGGEEESWFSISELGERLKKLKVVEEKEAESKIGGNSFMELRRAISTINDGGKEKPKHAPIQNLGLLTDITSSSSMDSPPKEHLVEKYFHPDNMSSEEKLTLELKKVRDEFKMHESDCGSTRVQIAQLTTEILHLSSVLHKKDKHSRRGLLAKVQQRKKLLKYLRRTDWESYCFVLSKLGLRDNPDYKN